MTDRTTFSFVEISTNDYEYPNEYRTVIIKGNSLERAGALSRFIKRKGFAITAIFQYDALDLRDAVEWLAGFTCILRNPNGHFWDSYEF